MRLYIFITYIIIFLLPSFVYSDDLTDIEITAPSNTNAVVSDEAIDDIKTRNIVDGGDLLQSVNGVNVIRRGGHGLDPVVRGQSDQRLNTFIDGAMVYGSCSSKMDVASTYVNVENYDTVTVIKGTQSVIYGAGGPGGVISYKRVTEPYSPDTFGPFKMKFGQTFDANSEALTTIGDITYSNGTSYLRLNSSYSHSGNYESGSGLKQLTEFRTSNTALIYGMRLGDGSKLEVSYTDNQQDNIGYPGLNMDIKYSHADIYNFKYHRVTPLGMFTSMKFEMFNSDMDHEMDNSTLRSTSTMRTPAASDTYGYRIIGAVGKDSRMGLDYEHNTRDAEQNMVISGTERHLTFLWPGAEVSKFGIFYEIDTKISKAQTLSFGVRWDQVEAEATRAGDDPGSDHMLQVTANSLYTAHYTGTVTAKKRDWDNISGFVRLEKTFNPTSKYYISMSHTERTPDATELFHAKTSMAMAMKYRDRHIGNPNLDSESHLTFELGFEEMVLGNSIVASMFYTDVDDFITTYRVSDGTFANNVNDARVYKNIDATLWGYEFNAFRDLGNNYNIKFNLNYTNGNDDSQSRPLPQIMPLAGDISLNYEHLLTNYGLRINFAASQDRVDTRVIDVGKTSGYGTLDLFFGTELSPGMDLTLGVSNLLDKKYSSHLSNANLMDASASQVDEPGRSIWGSIIYDF